VALQPGLVGHVDEGARLKSASTAQPENQPHRRVMFDVVVGECAEVLQLRARKEEALVFGRTSPFVLNLGLHSRDRV